MPVVKADFRSGPAVRSNPENACAARLSGLCVLLARIGGAALPNHPRYQLRYTRISSFDVFLLKLLYLIFLRFARGYGKIAIER